VAYYASGGGNPYDLNAVEVAASTLYLSAVNCCPGRSGTTDSTPFLPDRQNVIARTPSSVDSRAQHGKPKPIFKKSVAC